MKRLVSLVFFALALCTAHAMAATTAPPNGAVLTWHDDNFRTGWQQQETILTPATASKLGIAHTVPLKDQVDAQPLVLPRFFFGSDMAYLADESNNVYMVRGDGLLFRQRNLGAPVPAPFKCGNNGPNIGISSTPVIDWASQTLFVIAYVNVSGVTPTYFIHAINLDTLADKVPPIKVAASHTLTDGTAVSFNATYQRQRAALLFANGNVYAAFTSWCDFQASQSRGWLLGWSWSGTALAPLPANQLDDRRPPATRLLDTIWMSGAGPASDESGNLIFSTGNSAASTWADTTPCSGTGLPCSNIQESVVKLKGDLTGITGLFSPNPQYGSFSPNAVLMDQGDEDLGSGGVLLAPQRGSAFLAAVAGKDGRLFLFNRSGTGLTFLQLHQGSPCWCAPSYFAGSDGVGRIVASQGKILQTFQVPATALSAEGTSTLSTGQDGGFFTTVSCNGGGAFGNCTNTPIVWAVSRPLSTASNGVNLYAFSGLAVGGSYPLLFGPKQVGSWPNIGGNANIVPSVSHGQVYVASNKLLTILKEGGTGVLPAAVAAAAAQPAVGFSISGTLQAVNGSVLTLVNRDGKDRLIDDSEATARGLVTAALTPGDAYTATGSSFSSAGVLQADAIYRAKCRQHNEAGETPAGARAPCTGDQWPPDRDPGQ